MSSKEKDILRRKFLLGGAIVLTGLAGCTDMLESGPATDGQETDIQRTPTTHQRTTTHSWTRTATETDPGPATSDRAPRETTEDVYDQEATDQPETPEDTGTPEPAEFSVIGINAPSQAEIDTDVSITLTIKNVGEQEGRLTSEISWQAQNGQRGWQTLEDTMIDMIIPAGESKEFQQTVSWGYIETILYRYDQLYTEQAIEFVATELPRTETYTTPAGIEISIDNMEMFPAIDKKNIRGEMEKVFPDSNDAKFLKVTYTVTNTADALVNTPSQDAFSVALESNRDNDATAEYYSNSDELAWHYQDGIRLNSGESASGALIYEVYREYTPADLVNVFTARNDYGLYKAVWMPA